MKLLLVAATAFEIAPFIQYYQSVANTSWKKIHIEILITGVGLTAATYHISRKVLLHRPDMVLQAGLAGSFSEKLQLGEVVLVKKDTIADAMVKEGGTFRSVFEMGLVKKNQSPYKNGWLVNPLTHLPKGNFKKATAITVNEITTGTAKINYFRNQYQPDVESMEGAALHYVCNMEHLPYLQLRSISNEVGVRNKKKWKINEAIHQLNNGLMYFIDELHKEI